MVKEPSNVKQLSLNHVCKIGLIESKMTIYLLSCFQLGYISTAAPRRTIQAKATAFLYIILSG
jgi:hypothetical protein